jgi:hypothetical protein
MEKIANLLDDVTIINFKLIFRLSQRYISHVFAAAFLIVSIFCYLYFNQPVIFSASIPVKVVGKHSVSNDLMMLQQVDNASSISIGELSSMIYSFSFVKILSEEIISNSGFKKMNFGSIQKGKKVLGSTLIEGCQGNMNCTSEKLAGMISGLYVLSQGLTDDRYKLTVNSLDEATSLGLSKALATAIDKKRIQVRQYLVIKEIDSVKNLINQSREILEKQNGFILIEEEEKNIQVIADLREKLKILQVSISYEVANVSSLEAKLDENRKILKNSKFESGFKKSKTQASQVKIAELRSNLLAFSETPKEGRSRSDIIVLDKLRKEIAILEAEMPDEKNIR